ncbi:MAG: hypothetical protein IAF58_01125, partial [Leptolyngbya sp.]|nr:hypothetical protein [Candidatus Melainabacteria bacterium]
MTHSQFAYQPTLRQLLSAEAFAEAQLLYGEDLIDRPVSQVVSNLASAFRSGSLLVNRVEAFEGKELENVADLSAVVVIRPLTDSSDRPVAAAAGGDVVAKRRVPALSPVTDYEVVLERLLAICKAEEVPVISLPGFGEPSQIADEVRFTFLRQLKLNSTRLHAFLMNLVVEEGLEGLVDKIDHSISRISMLLPTYLFDEREDYKNLDIIYKVVVVYNQNGVNQQVKENNIIETLPIYKVFSQQEKLYHFTDTLGEAHQIEIFFCQNTTNNKSEMEIDLATIFEESRDNHDFLTCE